MSDKRRLPVLPSRPEGDANDDESRPRWHWAVFAAVMTFTAWLPLASAAGAIVRRRIERASAAAGGPLDADALRAVTITMVVAHAIALGLSALAAGWVVGKFSPVARPVDAALGACLCVMGAVVLSWMGAGFSPSSLLALGVAAPCAAFGARQGMKRRL